MSGIEIEDRSDETVNAGPPATTYVTLEIPGRPSLADLATLLGDNQEFVTNMSTRGQLW